MLKTTITAERDESGKLKNREDSDNGDSSPVILEGERKNLNEDGKSLDDVENKEYEFITFDKPPTPEELEEYRKANKIIVYEEDGYNVYC